MKKIITLIIISLLPIIKVSAQEYDKYYNGDYITGIYIIHDEEGTSKVKVYKMSNGTYRCETFDQPVMYNADGSVRLDEYNPEPFLRNKPIHEAVIVSGLVYNPKKQKWENGKIHHPFKKLWKADCDAWFEDNDQTLVIFGNLMGIGKKTRWEKID